MVIEATDSYGTLLRAVYPELRAIAARLLDGERDGHTLQPTALVHEAFVRLFGRCPDGSVSPQKFLAIAAHQMREVLIDWGRKHHARKHGGEFARVPLFEADCCVDRDEDALLGLNRALDRLGAIDPRALSIVELKFFGGYTNDEAAEILGVSDGTVESDWQFARSWLFGILSEKPRDSRL